MNYSKFFLLIVTLFVLWSVTSCTPNDNDADQPNTNELTNTSADSLPPTSIDLFENIQYSFSGISGGGTINIDTSLCSDIIRENVEFTIDASKDGKLSNGEFINIQAIFKDSFLTNNNYTVEKESLSVEVKNLYRIETATDFSEGMAWILLSDPYAIDYKGFWCCIDDSGKAVFQFEVTNEETSVTPYKNGYSYVLHENGNVTILDIKGNITSTYTPAENGDVLAYGEGYVFTSINISDFDNNYDLYTIYNADGKVLYDFSVLTDGKPTTGQVGSVNYCGDGVFGIGIRSAWTWPSWYYCAKTNLFIENIQGNTDATFSNDIACVSINANPDYLTFLKSSGETEIVNLPTDKSYDWNWWQKFHTNEGICLLWCCSGWSTEKCKFMLAYDIEKKSYIGLDEYWLDKIDCENLSENTTFIGGYIALPLLGNDGNQYVSIFDKSWKNILEPLACDEFIGFSGNRIVIRANDDYAAYDRNGNKIFALSAIGYTKMSNYSNGFAIVSGQEWFMGRRIEKLRYVDENGNVLFENLVLDNQKTIVFKSN